MKKTFRCSALFSLILLGGAGCGEEEASSATSNINECEYSTECDSNSNSTIDVVTDEYILPAESIISVQPIERDYKASFKLDSIDLKYMSGSSVLTLTNNSPRYFTNPTLSIDGKYYQLTTTIEPFQIQSVDLGLDDIRAVKFVDRQPFFKIFVNTYADHLNSEELSLPSEHNAYQYEQEMRGHKNVLNDLDFNVHFAEWLTNYDATRNVATYSFEDVECAFHDHAKSGNDSSPLNQRILSTLMHEPKSVHYMLTMSANGKATIGNGWLSVRDYRLYSEGQTVPKTTYLHEKMHNHGFGHDAGMTYGLPDVLINYMNDQTAFENYYEGKYLSSNIPLTTARMAIEQVDADSLDLVISFWAQDADKVSFDRYIKRLFLVTPEGVSIESVSAETASQSQTLTPVVTFADGYAKLYDSNFKVAVNYFNNQDRVTQPESIKIRIERPTTAQSFVFFGSGKPADWAQQANVHIQIGLESGLATDDGQIVLVDVDESHDEEGALQSANRLFTPSEAVQFCEDKGLSLGTLKTFRSQEQMDFQMKYLQYKTQVGIDPDLLEPVAVHVDSSYRPEYVNYVDAGELIVCAK